jgi:hypothetical protein
VGWGDETMESTAGSATGTAGVCSSVIPHVRTNTEAEHRFISISIPSSCLFQAPCSVHYISLLGGMGHQSPCQSATPFVISTPRTFSVPLTMK